MVVGFLGQPTKSPGVTSEVAEMGISKIESANTAIRVSTQDVEG